MLQLALREGEQEIWRPGEELERCFLVRIADGRYRPTRVASRKGISPFLNSNRGTASQEPGPRVERHDLLVHRRRGCRKLLLCAV